MDVLVEMRNGISRKLHFDPPGTPILRISAVRSGNVDLTDCRYLPEPAPRECLYSVQDGDLLFTRYNGSIDLVGVCGVVRGVGLERLVLYPDKLIRVRLRDGQGYPRLKSIFQHQMSETL